MATTITSKPTTAPPVPKWETLTPAFATELLDSSPGNRNVRAAVVEAYTRDILNDDWLPTGEAIKIDVNGQLIDGHHRCYAVIAANKPITVLIVRGLPAAARDVVDSGAPRRLMDVLKFRGYHNVTVLAAAVRVGVLFESGEIRHTMDYKTGGGQVRLTHAELLTWFEAHTDIAEIVDEYVRAGRRIGMPLGTFCYGIYRLMQIDAVFTREFVDTTSNAQTDGRGDPRLTLLDYCRRALAARQRIGIGEGLWLLFQAWSDSRAGVTPARAYAPFRGQGGAANVEVPSA